MINTTDTQRQTEYKLDYKVGSFNILYEDKWFLEVCLSRTAPRTAQFMPPQMIGYSEDMVVCSMANKSLPGPSHLWEMSCRTEFWQATCASPACWLELPRCPASGRLRSSAEPRPELQCLLTERAGLLPPCPLTNCTAVVLHVSTCSADLRRQTRNVLHARQWRWAITLRQLSWVNRGPWVNKSGESTDILTCSHVTTGSPVQQGQLYSWKKRSLAKVCQIHVAFAA